jgi:hypothetical protein
MQIQEKQMSALSKAQLARFGARMIIHIQKFFPKHFASLGEEQSRLLVHHGVERAEHYGITSERDVCKLIDLMLALGPDMDQKFPWVAARLGDTAVSASERVDAVYDALLATVKKRAEQA